MPRWGEVILRLLRKALRPSVWVTAERAFNEIFFLLLFSVQAPILGPSAFGLVAAVMVFITFWESVPGHAITEALLSIRAIEPRHFNVGRHHRNLVRVTIQHFPRSLAVRSRHDLIANGFNQALDLPAEEIRVVGH